MPHALTPVSRDIFGAEIQYFRFDPRYWEAVLDRLVDSGLRTVTTYVQWATHRVGEPDETHPAGVLDFEGRTDPRLNLKRFLELVTERGLNLNFRCGPFCCNEAVHGGYPKWLVMGDPSIMVWDYQNRAQQGYWIAKREGMQPSYLHPTYLDWCRRWFDEIDPIIRDNLKSTGGCITMLNLDNEVSYIVQDSFLGCDYNPVNVAPGGFYHQFLREKYGNDPLPYGPRTAAIEDIQPPRSVPDALGDDLAWYYDWAQFKQWAMQRYIRELRHMHEAHGITADAGVTFMTNFNPHRPEGVPTRMPAFEEAVGPSGLVGYDFYRGAFMSYSGYHSMARVLKLMNASMRYTWSAEFMSGTWNKDLSKASRVSDEHMRFMARCALAQGCKAISWFMFHDRDIWGDAPVSSHGHARTNLEVLRETPDLVLNKINNWDALTPRFDVAVIYDLASHLHTHLGDPSPCNDNALYVGKPALAQTKAGLASVEYEGLFRLIEQAGYQAGVVDIVHRGTLDPSIKLAFLPGTPVIEKGVSQALQQYVQAGGTLAITGCWPSLDDTGKPLAFLGLTQPGSATIGAGRVLWSPDYLGQTVAEHDTPQAIHTVADWISQTVGSAFHVRTTLDEPVQYITWNDASEGGVKSVVESHNLTSAVLHTSADEQILFALNHHIDAARMRVELGEAHRNATALIDLDTGESLPLSQGQTLVDIDRKSCRVFRVQSMGDSQSDESLSRRV